MKTNEHNTHTTANPPRCGNSVTESENPVAQLCDAYLDAGLTLGDAWDAALADCAHHFHRAA